MKRLIMLLIACFLLCNMVVLAEEEDYICAQPGDSGEDVRIVLEAANRLGFLKKLPKGMEEYLETYETGIRDMENALGLTEDGVIHLSEFLEIENAIGINNKSPFVKEVLERLFDLGYIKTVLPDEHDVYEKKYEAVIKNVEKKLGLKVDGIVTGSEFEIIKKQVIERPGKVKSLKVSEKNKQVTLTWSAVQGAAYYKIYRNGTVLCDVQAGGKTQYIDTNVSMGQKLRYYIMPYKYNAVGIGSDTVHMKVEIVYTQVNFKQLQESKDLYYVKFVDAKYVSGHVAGKDYIIQVSQTIDGKKYDVSLVMSNYKRWTGRPITEYKNLKTISAYGRYILQGSTMRIDLNGFNKLK